MSGFHRMNDLEIATLPKVDVSDWPYDAMAAGDFHRCFFETKFKRAGSYVLSTVGINACWPQRGLFLTHWPGDEVIDNWRTVEGVLINEYSSGRLAPVSRSLWYPYMPSAEGKAVQREGVHLKMALLCLGDLLKRIHEDERGVLQIEARNVE